MAEVTPQEPFIVDIRQPPKSDLEGLADVLFGALGVTGGLVVIAALVGGVLAAALIWIRSRSR